MPDIYGNPTPQELVQQFVASFQAGGQYYRAPSPPVAPPVTTGQVAPTPFTSLGIPAGSTVSRSPQAVQDAFLRVQQGGPSPAAPGSGAGALPPAPSLSAPRPGFDPNAAPGAPGSAGYERNVAPPPVPIGQGNENVGVRQPPPQTQQFQLASGQTGTMVVPPTLDVNTGNVGQDGLNRLTNATNVMYNPAQVQAMAGGTAGPTSAQNLGGRTAEQIAGGQGVFSNLGAQTQFTDAIVADLQRVLGDTPLGAIPPGDVRGIVESAIASLGPIAFGRAQEFNALAPGVQQLTGAFQNTGPVASRVTYGSAQQGAGIPDFQALTEQLASGQVATIEDEARRGRESTIRQLADLKLLDSLEPSTMALEEVERARQLALAQARGGAANTAFTAQQAAIQAQAVRDEAVQMRTLAEQAQRAGDFESVSRLVQGSQQLEQQAIQLDNQAALQGGQLGLQGEGVREQQRTNLMNMTALATQLDQGQQTLNIQERSQLTQTLLQAVDAELRNRGLDIQERTAALQAFEQAARTGQAQQLLNEQFGTLPQLTPDQLQQTLAKVNPEQQQQLQSQRESLTKTMGLFTSQDRLRNLLANPQSTPEEKTDAMEQAQQIDRLLAQAAQNITPNNPRFGSLADELYAQYPNMFQDSRYPKSFDDAQLRAARQVIRQRLETDISSIDQQIAAVSLSPQEQIQVFRSMGAGPTSQIQGNDLAIVNALLPYFQSVINQQPNFVPALGQNVPPANAPIDMSGLNSFLSNLTVGGGNSINQQLLAYLMNPVPVGGYGGV